MLRTSVPEATVDEDGYACAREQKVRATAHPRDRALVDSVAQTTTPELAPQCQLGPGVASRLTGHPPEGVR